MKISKLLTPTKAIISRVFFAGHNISTILLVANVKDNPYYYLLGLSLVFLLMETVFTMVKNRGHEWKWFSPSVLIFLIGSVPGIWLLELELIAIEEEVGCTVTKDGTLDIDDEADRLDIIQQVLVLVLIIGRWIVPKGEITRDELSQLLLVYIGMAADIIETFDVLEIRVVKENHSLVLVILSLWSWSLLQFTIVMTAKKKPLTREQRLEQLREARRKERIFHRAIFKRFNNIVGAAINNKRLASHSLRSLQPHPDVIIPIRPEDEINIEDEIQPKCVCLESEVWAIVTTMLLQDGPFLILRLILIFHFEVVSQFNIFFVCKNTLVLILQSYRLVVLQIEKQTDESNEGEAAQELWAKGVEKNRYAMPREGSRDPYTGIIYNKK